MATSKKIITLMLISIVAVIGTGCSDDAATPLAPVPVVDTAPPAVPANLDFYYHSDGYVALTWDANTTDADLAGYIVKRDKSGTVETLQASPLLGETYKDFSPLSGYSQYQVYSVDFTGNESAIVSVMYNGGTARMDVHFSN